jgi:hypothetical protein
VTFLLNLVHLNLASTVTTFAGYAVFALCAVTMRTRNGFRGLHDFISGTRVMRLHPHSTALAEDDVPAVAPLALAAGGIYGPYRVTGTIGPSNGNGTLFSGRDDMLDRSVWIYRRSTNLGESTTARLHVGRPTRPHWLQRGASDGQRWDAFEAVIGCPLGEVIANSPGLSWDKRLPLLADLAQELAASAADETLPETLTLDQVWVDRGGRIKLLDQAIEMGAARVAVVHEGVQSAPQRALAMLTGVIEHLSSDQLLPRAMRVFITELKSRAANCETLNWAARELCELAQRRSILKSDDRFGLLCCSAGTEGVLYIWTLIIIFGLFLMVFLHAGRGGLTASGGSALSAFMATNILIAGLGCWFRGGPAFRLLGIDVLYRDGQLAGRARCAVRSALAWTPQLIPCAMSLALVMSQIQASGQQAAPPNAELAKDPTRLPADFSLLAGLVCSAGLVVLLQLVGIVWAVARPQRGLQDRLVRSYLAPR